MASKSGRISRFIKKKQFEQSHQITNAVHSENISYFFLIHISINLFTTSSISFRSIPKIFESLLKHSIFDNRWIPHFTSIINWIMRVGLYLITRNLTYSENMTWIIDHTIQVGRKKALVILRLPVDIMKNKKAIKLCDAEVVSLVLKDKWTGNDVEKAMTALESKIGKPSQIISDNGADIKKGITQFVKGKNIHVTRDITHTLANLLKKKYDGLLIFQNLIKIVSNLKRKLQQSKFSHLAPPTLRSKARFMNLSIVTNWAKTMLHWKGSRFDIYPEESKKIFNWIPEYAHFFQSIDRDISAFNKIQKIIKTEGLDSDTYKECLDIMELNGIGPTLRKPLEQYLNDELKFSSDNGIHANISSDIIESLFGAFKQHASIHAMSEINRLVLIIPCLGASLTPEIIEEAFNAISMKEVSAWVKENASGTILSKRRNMFSQKYLEEELKKNGHKAA